MGIELPPDHTPQLCKALNLMMLQRKEGNNLLSSFAQILNDLERMETTGMEKDMFELGMYLMFVLERDLRRLK